MKKRYFSILAAVAIAVSSITYSVSADSSDIIGNDRSIKQKICLEEYEDLLLSLYSEESKDVDYPDEYGGIYYDSESEMVTICLTDLDSSNYYKDFFKKSDIEFKEVEYNLDELNETYEYISDHMLQNNVTVSCVSEKTNTVEVAVQSDEDKEKLISFVKNNGFDSDLISFRKNQAPIEQDFVEFSTSDEATDNRNISTNNYAYSGSKLYCGYNNNSYYYFRGTIGVNAYDPNTNSYGIITAGHVADSTCSSYCNSSYVSFNNNSNVTALFSGNCDAAFIPFNSNNTFVASSSLRNGNITTCVYDTQPIVSPYMVGIDVVKYGATTGRKEGTITSLSTSVTYANNVVINDVIEYDMERAGGDSGAPMGIEYTNGNGLYFMGVHSGGSGTTCYATKLRNIENDLGVVIITAI